jgi:hypothetical protein
MLGNFNRRQLNDRINFKQILKMFPVTQVQALEKKNPAVSQVQQQMFGEQGAPGPAGAGGGAGNVQQMIAALQAAPPAQVQQMAQHLGVHDEKDIDEIAHRAVQAGVGVPGAGPLANVPGSQQQQTYNQRFATDITDLENRLNAIEDMHDADPPTAAHVPPIGGGPQLNLAPLRAAVAGLDLTTQAGRAAGAQALLAALQQL